MSRGPRNIYQCPNAVENQEKETSETDSDRPDQTVSPGVARADEREHTRAREHGAERQQHEPANAPSAGREGKSQSPAAPMHPDDPGRQRGDIRGCGLRQRRLSSF